MSGAQGPLSGIRVVEFAGIGPAPFCAMLLSDMGADVLRIDRAGSAGASPTEIIARGRRSLALDLKEPHAKRLVHAIAKAADIVIEGFRPGVMERLGLGPDDLIGASPALVYGRMTGWGQTGPLAHAAGHDINYIALTGALGAIGPRDGVPLPPLNLVGDFGGGGLYLAMGVLAALLQARETGRGQVVDAAIVDGVASLSAMMHWFRADGHWRNERGSNLLDGGAPFYRCYACSDGKSVAVGPVEPHFYAILLDRLGLAAAGMPAQNDASGWRENSEALASLFATRTREEWCELLEGTDACFAPVLSFDEAPDHPHNRARANHVEAHGVVQPAPAPRFSVTPGAIQGPPPSAGEGGMAALAEWGVPTDP